MRRALLLLLLCLPAFVRADEPVRFLIERIEVRHLLHASPDVIRAESRLREGESYTEGELRDANNSIRRLPFILDAAFSLERGSGRGAYVLVVTVNETKPFFYAYDLVLFDNGSGAAFIDTETPAVAGVRWFAGREGVFHLAALQHKDQRPFESEYTDVQAGYTRYGLLGGRAFATLTVNRYYSPPVQGGDVRPGAELGMSLAPNQTLTLTYTDVDLGVSHTRVERVFEARLAYNTTNHPFFPTSGSLVSLAPVVAWTDSHRPPTGATATHSFNRGLDGHAAQYWSFGERYSLGAVADGGALAVDRRTNGVPTTYQTAYGTGTLKLTRILGDPRATDVEKRLELTSRLVSPQKHDDVSSFVPQARLEFSLAWVRRTSWGFVRLGVGYGWQSR